MGFCRFCPAQALIFLQIPKQNNLVIAFAVHIKTMKCVFVCAGVLHHSNSISVIQRRSVILTTLFLGRLSLSKQLTST